MLAGLSWAACSPSQRRRSLVLPLTSVSCLTCGKNPLKSSPGRGRKGSPFVEPDHIPGGRSADVGGRKHPKARKARRKLQVFSVGGGWVNFRFRGKPTGKTIRPRHPFLGICSKAIQTAITEAHHDHHHRNRGITRGEAHHMDSWFASVYCPGRAGS